jgi:hypothetical protein
LHDTTYIVLECTVVLRIFGPKKDEMRRKRRKLHNEDLRNLYSSLNVIKIIKSRRMRWAGHEARIGENRNPYKLFVRKPEGKKPLGRPRHTWVNNIKMDLGEKGWGGVDWLRIGTSGELL